MLIHTVWRRAVCLAVFVPALLGAQAVQSGKTASLESTVDPTIKPGDDFFAYANGAWLAATQIPAGKDRWGARDDINRVNRERVMRLLEDARNAPAGSPARKIADFRAALANDAAIEARGIASLRPQLDSIDRIHDGAALARMLGRTMRADVDPLNWGVYRSATLLGLAVEPSIHGEKTNVAFLVQGGLGLPDRDDYVNGDAGSATARAKYRAYVARILNRAGFDRAEQRADGVLSLETAIAQTQTTREQSASDHRADTVWTRDEFMRGAPGLDWSAFFAAAGLAKQKSFVPWQPSAVKGVAALAKSQPLDVWKDYLRVRAIDAVVDALPGAFARDAVGPQPSSRAERADALTQLAMSDALGRLYAERYFSPAQKARVQKIVANVTAAFIRRVEGVSWMTPRTRATALEKLKALYVGVGYPEHWPHDGDLVVDANDAAGNLRRVADRDYRRALALLGAPVDMKQWWIAPHTVGAVLVFQQNAYDFAAALLQAPKYDSAASDAASYGAIGAIIAHDVAHFVDVLGAEYETDGRMRRWWTPEDVQHFQAAAEPLIKQFSTYRPFPDVAIDGKLTLTENVADLAGLGAAFEAYRLTLGDKASDKAFVRRSDREFFIAFAQSWRVKITDGAMRTQAATNDHAPETYRISTVRNIDAWYDAFDVKPGDRLYLEPSARVRVW